MDDAIEETTGAFVPLGSQDPLSESYLVPIILKAEASGGMYTLTTSPQVHSVWADQDRTNSWPSGSMFDASVDTTLYVEGIGTGSGNISVDWQSADGMETINNADTIKVTTFDWSGSTFVSGGPTHTYTATGGVPVLDSKWVTPVNGLEVAGTNVATDPDSVDIQWNAGPGTGKAVYQAHANYVWDLRVDIVKIDLDASIHNGTTGELDDASEESVGAFLPFNDGNCQGDRLGIVLRQMEPVGLGMLGMYTLDYTVTQLRLSTNADGTGFVLPSTQYDPMVNTVLWVEAVAAGSSFITINWSNGVDTIDDADKIKVTAFEWSGPTVVIADSTRSYSSPGAAAGIESKWVAPVNGAEVAGSNVATNPDTVDIHWGPTAGIGQAVYQAHTNYVWNLEVDIVDSATINLEVAKINHNLANGSQSDADEDTIGGYVPLNNDDDDYDAANLPDQDQLGAISGETDLLEIFLEKIEPVGLGGEYTLDIPSNVRVWQNEDRSGEVKPASDAAPTVFDATMITETSGFATLYVEGWTVGNGLIKVNWSNGADTIDDADEVKVTTFDWSGPLNVPGHAIYTYAASGGATGLGNSTWLGPDGGSISTITETASGTDSMKILWDGGPVVGKAVYQAHPDYIWDLEVNVVQVKIKSTGNTPSYNNTPFQVTGAGSPYIKASDQVFALTADIVVETVTGPTVNGDERGKKFIEVGIVHQARFDAKHALYNDSMPKQRVRSSLEDGNIHWDASVAGTIPWQHIDSNGYLNITSDSTVVTNKTFKFYDNPGVLATDPAQFVLAGDQVDVLGIVMKHWVYLAVRAKGPNIFGSNNVLTQRVKFEWQFDGTGTIDEAGVWTRTGTGVTGDPTLTEVTTGLGVAPAAANLNEALASQTWIVENQ